MAQELGSKRIVGLDIIRSLAILSVMASHILSVPYHKYRLTSGLCGVLAIYGVEVFFVLSGYLIGGILMRDMEGGHFDIHAVTHFWKRRWFRTLPNYYLFLIVSIIVAVCAHRPIHDLYKYFFFWQNISTGSGTEFFGVSWSLCLEEWAYLVLPITSLILTRFIPVKRNAVILTIILFLLTPTIFRIFAMHSITSWDDSFRKGVIYHLDGIFFGVSVALADRYFPKVYDFISNRITFFVSLFVLICIAALLVYLLSFRHVLSEMGPQLYPSAAMNIFLLTVIDIVMMPIVAFSSKVRLTPEPIKKIFVAISTYSYALYLCHLFALMITYQVVGHLMPISKLMNIVIIIFSVSLSFLIAVPVYHLYEKRITRMRELFPSKVKAKQVVQS